MRFESLKIKVAYESLKLNVCCTFLEIDRQHVFSAKFRNSEYSTAHQSIFYLHLLSMQSCRVIINCTFSASCIFILNDSICVCSMFYISYFMADNNKTRCKEKEISYLYIGYIQMNFSGIQDITI